MNFFRISLVFMVLGNATPSGFDRPGKPQGYQKIRAFPLASSTSLARRGVAERNPDREKAGRRCHARERVRARCCEPESHRQGARVEGPRGAALRATTPR